MTRIIQSAIAAAFLVTLMIAPSAAQARGRGGMDGFMTGLNGVVTALADPVAGFADPPDRYDGLPLHEVTGRVLGLVEGVGVGAYRAATGIVDIVAAPFFVVPRVSPRARFSLLVDDRGVLAP